VQEDSPLGPVVLTAGQVQARVRELGERITADYAGRRPLFVGVLKGAFVFLADLVRCVDLPLEVDFMAVSSYGSSTSTSGVVRIVKDLDQDLAGRDVILVEDIADSGLTLSYLRKALLARQPASLEVCTLLARADQSDSVSLVRYLGFTVAPGWVVGYGLDVAEQYRNLVDIHLHSAVH
jgi:hypoxanthine phosphoribosyltransferase